MQYTVRAFVEGRGAKVDEMCRTFSSMERTAYNLLRDGVGAGSIKAVLRERYGVRNARWVQSATNQAGAVVKAQEEGTQYRVELCREKAKNTREKMERLSNPLKIEGCRVKIAKYESKTEELREQLRGKSYPRAVFGSRKLLHKLSIADGKRHAELREEWDERRSNHFFSVGQANQRGNANARLSCGESDNAFSLELRNWPGGDFSLPLHVPEHWADLVKCVIARAASVKLGSRGESIEGGLSYSVRVVRSAKGYQVLASFELDEPSVEWSERLA